jgi:4-amino-4-deoxy-L-arabinose transferase-like glycosyltransferase
MPVPRVAYPIIAIGFAFLVLQAARSGYDHDEIQHLHAAWLVSRGQQPFHDFFEQRHPTNFYLLAPLTRAFEGSPHALVFAARLLDLGVLAALLAAFLAIARPLLRDPRAVWPPLLLLGCFFFVRNSMEVRPDPWMNALCVLGLWQWTAYLRQGGIRRAILSGFLFGAAFVFLQKALAFVGLVALGTLVSLWDPQVRERAARGAAALVAAAVVPVGLFALAIWRAGYWSDFVFWNYTFNRFYYLNTNFDGPSALATVAISIGEDPLLWIAGLIGLSVAARFVLRREGQPTLVIAATVVIGMLAGLFESRWPFSHNLLLMQPPLALIAAVAIDRLSSTRSRLVASTLLLVMVAKVAVMCVVYTEGHHSKAIQELLLARAKPSDPIAVPPPYHPIFRQDAFFFWYVPVNNSIAYLELCKEHPCPADRIEQERQAWERRPPRFVYIPVDEPTWAPFEFDKHRTAYRRTDIEGLWER